MSKSKLSRQLTEPFLRFIGLEVSGGIILLAATIGALAWANTAPSGYQAFWRDTSFAHWVNEGLMAIFFLVVGMEIKREMLWGELAGFKKAALPIAAAVGGMVVPALIYAFVNRYGPGARGWGIPMATDIAFALGVLALAGRRVPISLKVFLTALAIADDLGAVAVIAIVYTSTLALPWLAGAAALTALLALIRVRSAWIYLGAGVVLWFLMLKSGIHATVAGVALAAVIPAGKSSCSEFLEHLLHPVSTYFIVPVFALANAGIALSLLSPSALAEPIGLGVLVGLVIGKPVGIVLFSVIAIKSKIAEWPRRARLGHVVGVGILAGIGFTMSIFVAELAFADPQLVARAKGAVLAASLLSAVLGLILLSRLPAHREPADGD